VPRRAAGYTDGMKRRGHIGAMDHSVKWVDMRTIKTELMDKKKATTVEQKGVHARTYTHPHTVVSNIKLFIKRDLHTHTHTHTHIQDTTTVS